MTRLLILLLTLCTMFACETLKRVEWPDLLQCVPSAPDLIGLVGSALDGEDYRERLEQLALDEDSGAVLCAVREVVDDLSRESAGAPSAREQRARAFLADTGTKFR